MKPMKWSLWPRTLFMRLTLILFVGLVVAHAFSFWVIMRERTEATTGLMLGYMEQDVASSVALLDRLPASERAAWLPRLERRTYSFSLAPGMEGHAPDTKLSSMIAASFVDAIGSHYPVTANVVPGQKDRVQAQLELSDGSPLTIDMRPAGLPMSGWLPVVLLLQLILLAGFTWIGVRLATRPLAQLADAADTLGPDLRASRLAEDGPLEVARAAKAFNAMQERIALYMTERMQILAAISHDLQTPITRMRMRADMMDDSEQRKKLNHDLKEMEVLVREGVAYARTLHGTAEAPCTIDPDALLDSLVFDYVDAGQQLSLSGKIGHPIVTRPNALRRVLINLIDNALKFSTVVEVALIDEHDGRTTILVLDNGPGIPEDELETVFQPFYRVETSRNRDTGGTGLGLAIAKQLTLAMNATLTLQNRSSGGLEARLTLADIQGRVIP
ncbi:sensor histidine kinase [Herminiimonas fonticola]|uniref:histidine kinase n=1 Tax=Herminiimonas fonticola TaxID=303380 RepID=A0A4R6G5N5_9BURK|nr:HAMP domain-containing sensor histidine kinase [Herminiimonas fonticola]RBA23741.1 Histidine kinase-, DNA gyrase B-, and HSP90-like ATPase [Herminiimonas fonticola]TDN89742.1 signal transduction histidine kinase [Herminiimonas fonticola]